MLLVAVLKATLSAKVGETRIQDYQKASLKGAVFSQQAHDRR